MPGARVSGAPLLGAMLFGAALLAGACGERGPSPVVPGFQHNVVLLLEGTLTTSCEVQSFQECADGPFGSGINPGTPVSLRVTYDSASVPIYVVRLETLEVVRYYGITTQLSVGGDSLPTETASASYIEVSSAPESYEVRVTVARGFSGGTVAGLSVDYAEAALKIEPSLHPSVALPTTPAAFAAALNSRPFSIALKHHTDPDLSDFGLAAPGALVVGQITAVRAP